MKRQALFMVLSGKAKDNEIIIVDELKLTEPKTKEMAGIVKNLEANVKKDLKKGVILIMPEKNETISRASRNLSKFTTIGVKSLNVLDLLSFKYLLIPKKAIDMIGETYKK